MLVHLRRAIALVFLLLVVPVVAAHAGKPTGNFTPQGFGASLEPLSVGPSSPTAACTPGETRSEIGYLQYILPPDDRYYTLISPSSCTACGASPSIEIATGHMAIYFPANCTTVIGVSVVGVKTLPGNPTCKMPDEANVLCPPTYYSVTPVSGAGGYNVGLPLPAGCCISGDAFLCFNIVRSDCDPYLAQLGIYATAAPCNPCQSWNFYPSGTGTAMVDLCGIFSQYSVGNLKMYADANCCSPVPGLRKTWGSIKNIYR